jgi:hypothetical protein
MKKIALLVVGVGLLAACSATQKEDKGNVCKIEGKDCWKVAQLVNKTKEVYSDTETDNIWQNNIKYENPDLEAMGLKVTFHTMYRDGGSTTTVINDNVAINVNRRLGPNPDYGNTTVKFKESGKQFVFDPQGKLKE